MGKVLKEGGGVLQVAVSTAKGLPETNLEDAYWRVATHDPGSNDLISNQTNNFLATAWPGYGTGLAWNDFVENCSGVLWR